MVAAFDAGALSLVPGEEGVLAGRGNEPLVLGDVAQRSRALLVLASGRVRQKRGRNRRARTLLHATWKRSPADSARPGRVGPLFRQQSEEISFPYSFTQKDRRIPSGTSVFFSALFSSGKRCHALVSSVGLSEWGSIRSVKRVHFCNLSPFPRLKFFIFREEPALFFPGIFFLFSAKLNSKNQKKTGERKKITDL